MVFLIIFITISLFKIITSYLKNKIFIDYFRNKKGATSVCPYSLRLSDRPSISCPIKWSELYKIKPDDITIFNRLDKYTIVAYLQKLLNDNKLELATDKLIELVEYCNCNLGNDYKFE